MVRQANSEYYICGIPIALKNELSTGLRRSAKTGVVV